MRDAWQHYLKNDNQGRGVVLIGHSQGAFILQALIANEIDGKPVQKQLVGAYILGATFLTPKGKDVGGQFKQIPLCRKPGQIGCVVNYSAFRSTVTPPANTLFGNSADPASSGNCTNPATLGAGSAPLRAYLSTSGRMIAMGGGAPKPWAADKTVDTPFVSVPGLLTAECKTNEFATYLEIKVNGDPGRSARRRHHRRPRRGRQAARELGPAPDRCQSRDGQPARPGRAAVEGVSLATLSEHGEAGRHDAARRIV